jgi:regulator of protease activity HflC (stomatin/prohibitin superfamily)
MSAIFLFVGLTLAAALVFGGFQSRLTQVRIASLVAAAVVLFVAFTLASFRLVKEDQVGIVTKNIGWTSLPPGKIIATNGEKGPQASVLPPGWHPWYWPFIYEIDNVPLVEVPAGQIGLLEAADGNPLPEDATYAPEWPAGEEKRMAENAEYYLTDGGGYRGPQTSVLKPAKYRINPKLFKIKMVPITTIEKAQVGVVKSNVGQRASGEGVGMLVNRGERGIWREPLTPAQYYLNTDAQEVTIISTQMRIVHFTMAAASRTGSSGDEREIIVRTSDGFTFPVDVRIEYEIKPQDAPLLVASVGDDKDGLRQVMDSRVRAIFRNNAENVKALDYVKQRSHQESQSLKMLQDAMSKIGVTITGVRIGDVGNEETLGSLLKTQTDREIALQEQETFREQQRAAEQKKLLTKTEQEAEEEKRLATASYEVQIAEQRQKQRVIQAEAEAKAIQIQAEAQANAYQLIASQIGSSNAALIELLKIVGERGISITPRVMVVGQGGASGQGDGQTTALIGTMLDTMIDRTPTPPQPAQSQPRRQPTTR